MQLDGVSGVSALEDICFESGHVWITMGGGLRCFYW
jgi:hypothetical protein